MSDPLSMHPYIDDLSLCADEIPILTACAQLPRLTGRCSRRFDRYYSALAESFMRLCRVKLFPRAESEYRKALCDAAPLTQWHAELTATVTFHSDRLVSLHTDVTLTGMPQRQLYRRGDTWDLRRGLLLSVQDCFPPRTPCRRRLTDAAEAQIQTQQAQGISLYCEDWRSRLRRNFDPHRFYLTEDALCFFYPMYAIAPAVEGIPTFSLPYDAEKGPFLPKT